MVKHYIEIIIDYDWSLDDYLEKIKIIGQVHRTWDMMWYRIKDVRQNKAKLLLKKNDY